MLKKPNHEFTLGEALEDLLSSKRIKKGLTEALIKQQWPQIMGDAIAKHTTAMYFKEGVLTLYCNSSVIKNELRFHKDKAIQLINEALKDNAVSEIIIK
jgi:predicted nucleic acid-binding Zn ribbon protein